MKIVSTDSAKDFTPAGKACVICNKTDGDKHEKSPRKNILAKVRNDIITERLSSLSEEAVFYYHVNKCATNNIVILSPS